MKYKKNARKRDKFLVKPVTYSQVLEDGISEKDKVKEESIMSIVVTITNGKQFYADPISRADMTDAIAIAGETGQTEVMWKLPVQGFTLVTLAEMKEARMLGLQAKGTIIGG